MSFILVTGVPGSGKTSLSKLLAERLGLKVIHVTELIKEKKLFTDVERDACGDPLYVVDMEALEEYVNSLRGEWIIEGVVVDFVPSEKTRKVIYLYASVSSLYNRMRAKGYCEKKICDNLEAELVGSYLNILVEKYGEKVNCLSTDDELERVVQRALSIVNCGRSPCPPIHEDSEWEYFFRVCPLE